MAQEHNSIVGRVRRWRQYRTTVRELEKLSPRELDDLGINRYAITSVARNAVDSL